MTTSQALLIGFIIAPTIFILCAYFTRAGLRRIASGLVGMVAFILVQYAWDWIAASAGWWSYPAYGTGGRPPMPVPVYIFSGLVFAGFGLVGWRVARRHGWKRTLAFLAVWSLWGFAHDYVGSNLFSSSLLMVIKPGVVPAIADFFVYITGMAVTLLAIRVVGGPFQSV